MSNFPGCATDSVDSSLIANLVMRAGSGMVRGRAGAGAPGNPAPSLPAMAEKMLLSQKDAAGTHCLLEYIDTKVPQPTVKANLDFQNSLSADQVEKFRDMWRPLSLEQRAPFLGLRASITRMDTDEQVEHLNNAIRPAKDAGNMKDFITSLDVDQKKQLAGLLRCSEEALAKFTAQLN